MLIENKGTSTVIFTEVKDKNGQPLMIEPKKQAEVDTPLWERVRPLYGCLFPVAETPVPEKPKAFNTKPSGKPNNNSADVL